MAITKLLPKEIQEKISDKTQNWAVIGQDYNNIVKKLSEVIDEMGGDDTDFSSLDVRVTQLETDVGILQTAITGFEPLVTTKKFVGFTTKGASTKTSGAFTAGKTYEILTYNSDDDFTNLGASANEVGATFTAGTLTGSVAHTTANRAAVKQVDTVTLTGTGGAVRVTGAGGLTKTLHFTSTLDDTAALFETDNAVAYLAQGIVVTAGTATIIFTADVAGTGFTSPVVTNVPYDLAGTVANTVVNRVAVKQIDTVTVTGTGGALSISGAGTLTKILHFDTSLGDTVDSFVTDFAADYLAKGIVVTASDPDIIFTAETAGTGFTTPVVTNIPYDVDGTVVNTQANVTAVKQKDTITLTGTSGTAVTSGGGLEAKLITFVDTLDNAAAQFVTDHAAAYLAVGVVVTASTNTLIFEANVAGTAFVHVDVLNVTGNLDGTMVPTTANRVAVKQKDTMTLTGTIGYATIGAAGGLTKNVTFATDLTTTAAAFVTDNATEYAGQAIVLTSSGANLIFEAAAAGTGFTSPTITDVPGNLAGTDDDTQANVTALKQKDTMTLTGTFGKAVISAAGGLTKDITFVTSPTITASTFVTENATEYLGQAIVLTSSGVDLIFEAEVAETGFTSPIITSSAGNLAGGVVNTFANITAVKQKETLTLTGTSGSQTVTAAGGLTKIATFATDLTTTAAAFVTAHATAYSGQAIVLTSSGANLIFEAAAAGTGFTAPLIAATATAAHYAHASILGYDFVMTVSALENTVGTIVWARTAVGTYTGTSTGAFPSGYTFFPPPYYDGTNTVTIERTSDNIITLKTYLSGVLADISLTSFPVEFSVYAVPTP
jgi:hypothetical protein